MKIRRRDFIATGFCQSELFWVLRRSALVCFENVSTRASQRPSVARQILSYSDFICATGAARIQ